MSSEVLLVNGLLGGAVAFIGWVLKGTVTKADYAHSGVVELRPKVVLMNQEIKELQDMKADIRGLSVEIVNIKESQHRIEAYLKDIAKQR